MSSEQGSSSATTASPAAAASANNSDRSASTAEQTGLLAAQIADTTISPSVHHRCTCMSSERSTVVDTSTPPSSPTTTTTTTTTTIPTPTATAVASAPAAATVITLPPANAYWQCDDDPPPYASLIGTTEHPYAWSYVFPSNSHYEDSGGTGSDNRAIARQLVSIPLTSYGIFKIEPPRYAAATATSAIARPLPYPRLIADPGPPVKSSPGTARKYGAILIAAMVIIFLMLLSLMVRFVTEKSLWRG